MKQIFDIEDENIRAYYSRLLLDDSEREVLERIVRKHYLKKGDFMLREGESCDFVASVFRGILYSYHLNEKGDKEVTQFFHYPNNPYAFHFDSFLNNSNSDEYIECLEDACVLLIEKKDIIAHLYKFPKFANMDVEISRYRYTTSLRRIKILLHKSAVQRIAELQNQNPELFHLIPNYLLASYLGMHRNTYLRAMREI